MFLMVVTNLVKIVSISIPWGSLGYCFSDRGCGTKTKTDSKIVFISFSCNTVRSYLYWSLQEYYNASLCVRTNTPFSFVIRSEYIFIGPYKNITKPHYVIKIYSDRITNENGVLVLTHNEAL
jgi:hypothetical protein